jgi:periplasmic divalent cation tolerance protein
MIGNESGVNKAVLVSACGNGERSETSLIDEGEAPIVRSSTMTEFIVVYVTVGSADEAESLASSLIEERLAACVTRIKDVQSIYRWEGKIERSAEELLIIKARRDAFDALRSRVEELHSYSVPEVIALPVLEGNPSYLQWLNEQVPKRTR